MSSVTAIRCIFLLDGLILAKWLPCLPAIQQRLDLDLMHLGIALAAVPLGIIAGLPFIGPKLVSRFDDRVTVAVGLFWLVVSSTLAGFATDLTGLSVALFLYGTAVGTMEVVMNTAANAIERREARRIMSSCHGLWSVGSIGGAALGAVLLASGLTPRDTLSLEALPAALASALLIRWTAPVRPPVTTRTVPVLPSWSLIVLCMLPFCACVLEGAMGDWAAIYLQLEHHLVGPIIGAGYLIFACTMAATRLYGDRLIDRAGPVVLAKACGCLRMIGLVLISFAPSIVTALLGFGAMGLAASLVFPMSVTAAAEHAGAPAAVNIAALSIICFSGYLIGPPVVVLLAGQFGLRWALLLLLPLAVGVVALAGLIRPAATLQPARGTEFVH